MQEWIMVNAEREWEMRNTQWAVEEGFTGGYSIIMIRNTCSNVKRGVCTPLFTVV